MDFAPPLQLPPPQWAAIEAAYATPPRAYHNLDHVHEVLRHFADVAAGPGWAQPGEVYLAVLYHDAVYEAGRTDNEERSAELARAHVARWMPGIDAERVVELIRLTQRHGQLDVDSVDRDAALFLDCDMAILGATPTVFGDYDRGICAEYRGKMPAWLFKLARRRFLKALLGRERIYLSDYFHARLDSQARLNLQRAISS
jgi:predicted metal-dependent HD superfamily phosphohydrolase